MKFSDKLGAQNVVYIQKAVMSVKAYEIAQIAWDYCEAEDSVYLGFDEVDEDTDTMMVVWAAEKPKDMEMMNDIIFRAQSI